MKSQLTQTRHFRIDPTREHKLLDLCTASAQTPSQLIRQLIDEAAGDLGSLDTSYLTKQKQNLAGESP
jgi:hypothetical protein